MSGIAGVIGKTTETAVVESMLSTMTGGCFAGKVFELDPICCLLETGYGNEYFEQVNLQAGENYTVVFCGSLFNAEDIRLELAQIGYRLEKATINDLILFSYIQWGEQVLNRFNGVFTFAIWNKKEGTLFIARDRIGVKPLFYRLTDGLFIFASRIKTILAHPDVDAIINDESVAQLLLLGPGRIPGSGVLKDIHELKPGCYGVYAKGKWTQTQYWKLTDREHTESFEETADHVRELLEDAINRQMVSDVPVGAFLSGGLDSSIVSSVINEICCKKGKQLQTFSVDYLDSQKYFQSNKFQPESDREYIIRMRQELNSNHLDVILSPEDLIACLDDATIARDLPGMGDVDFSLYAFTKRIHEHVSVAFSGECADEIFGGYPWYRDPEIRTADGFPWAQNTTFRAGFIQPVFLNSIDPQTFVMDNYRTTIHQSDILPGTNRLERRMKELVNLNFDWFMQTLLDRNDRMCMTQGLDVRVPFCDYRIAEYLYGVPWDFKDYGGREKGLLRYAMKGILPESVLYRKKSPYPKTYDPKYLEIVSKMLLDVINDPNSPILQIVRKSALENLLMADFQWPWYGQLMKLPQTIAYMLQLNRWMILNNVKLM